MNTIWKAFRFLLLFAALLATSSPLYGQDEKFTIIFTGGSKGYLQGSGEIKGLARKVTLIKQLEAEAKKNGRTFMAMDSGNTIAPFYLSRLNRGKTVLSALKDNNYTALSIGNQEFSYGQDYLESLTQNGLPYLSANIFKGKETFAKPSMMIEKNGIKIGVFGLTSPSITEEVSSYILKGLTFKPVVESAKKTVEALKKKGAQIIICVGFLEIKEAYKIADNVRDINVIIRNYHESRPLGGVEEYTLQGQQNRALVVAPQKNNQSVGVLEFEVRKKDKEARLWKASITFKEVTKDLKRDEETVKKIEKVKTEMAKKIGVTLLPYSPGEALPIEFKKKAFATMVSDIVRLQYNTEISILNLELFNEKQIKNLAKKKEFTYLDVEKIFTNRSSLTCFTLTGSQIVDIYKNQQDDEPLVFSGVTKKNGSFLINGVPVRGGDHYWVTSNKFLASGTTGYPQFKNKANQVGRFRINKNFEISANDKGVDLSIQESFNAFANNILKDIGRGPNPAVFKSQIQEVMDYQPATYMLIFDNLRLTYSEITANSSSQLASTVPDSRASAKNERNISFAGKLVFLRHTPFWLLENRVGVAFGQTDVEGQPKNTSTDDLFFESESSFIGLGYDFTATIHMVPYLNVRYDTELEKDQGIPLEKILYFSAGAAGISPGPLTKLKVGALGKADFTGGNDKVQYGLVAEATYSAKYFDAFTIDSNALLYYIPDQDPDPGNLQVRFEWNTIFKMPFYNNFNFVIDVRFFGYQEMVTNDWGNHVAVSVGISYFRAWKFLYEPFFGTR